MLKLSTMPKTLAARSMNFSISLLYVVLKFLLFLGPTCMSVDNISRMEFMKDGDVLVSKGGTFALGFFSPGTSTSRYLGIWYNNVSLQTVVWVANRDDPIKNNSGVLLLNSDGNLVLYVQNQNNIIWSTNTKVSMKNVKAQILDTGNLKLVQGDIYGKNMKAVVWQSFDHPTNTLLPQMKLWLDRSTGLNRSLTSWKSNNDPGIGNISLSINPDGYPQLFFYENMQPKWRLGSWNGYRWTGTPRTIMLNSTFVNNQDEISVTWDNYSGSPFGRLIVHDLGSVIEYSWNPGEKTWMEQYTSPRELCDNYQHCGPYGKCVPPVNGEFECTCLPGYQPKSLTKWNMRDGSSGCVRKNNKSMCRAGEGFVTVESVKIPDTSVAVVHKSLRPTSECKEKCSKNCSCTAYAIADIRNQVGCITWHGGLNDTRDYSMGRGQDFFIRVDAIELAQYRKSRGLSSAKKSILILSAGVVSLIAIVLMYFWIKKKKRGLDEQAILHTDATSTSSSFNFSTSRRKGDESETDADVPLFDLKTILAGTGNFSPANKLGQGGFGSVYKGKLANGREIAVKRLLKVSGQGIGEFKNEVVLTVKLQHKNLVRLLGCCIDKDEKMLVYEYLPNKSLDRFLFDKTKSAMLDWKKRFEIIFGIARGVLYLHEDSRLKIIHRDLKASNVLLDATMNPKIADFGMARMFGDDQRNANTNRVVGTFGYMSPEYAMEGQYSIKSDVFSFGVLLLEIISGRRNTNYYDESLSLNLIGHVWQLWREGNPLDVVDSTLGMSYPSTEVMRCIQIGLLCVQESPDDRPSMLEVVFMLGNETSLPSPSKPAFIFKKRCSVSESSASIKGGSSTSTNELTITTLEPR